MVRKTFFRPPFDTGDFAKAAVESTDIPCKRADENLGEGRFASLFSDWVCANAQFNDIDMLV
jgi:hypothetical protein